MAKIRASCFERLLSQRVFLLASSHHHNQTQTSTPNQPLLLPISLIRGLASLSSLLLEHICVGHSCGEEQSQVIFVLAASHRPGGHIPASLHEQATNKGKSETGKRAKQVNFVTLSLTSILFSTFQVFYELELRCTVDLVVPWCRSCPSTKFFPPPDFDESSSPLPSDNLSSPAVRARRRICDSFILSITYSYVSRPPISHRRGNVPEPDRTGENLPARSYHYRPAGRLDKPISCAGYLIVHSPPAQIESPKRTC